MKNLPTQVQVKNRKVCNMLQTKLQILHMKHMYVIGYFFYVIVQILFLNQHVTNIMLQNERLINPNTSQEVESNLGLFKRRTLLRDCRRQADLTPRAARLYKIATNLMRRKRYMDAQNSLRKKLRASRCLQSEEFIEQYEGLSLTHKGH